MQNELDNVGEIGDWAHLVSELKRRTFEPINHVPFVFYVVLAIIFFGGLGVWVEIFKISKSTADETEYGGLITAVLTYYPTIIGSAAIQLAFISNDKRDKILLIFAILLLVVFFAIAVLLSVGNSQCPALTLFEGTLCCLVAVWTWWITNSDDPTFRKVMSPDAATGGNTDRQLPGGTDGYKV